MSKYIDQRIEKFNSDISSMSNQQAAKRAIKEVKQLLKKYTPATTRTYLTRYRKALTEDKSLLMKHLKLPKQEQIKVEKNYATVIAESQKERKEIKNYEQMIQKAIRLLDSTKYSEITSALCFLTGRRATEILKTAKFTNSKNSQKVMYFEGQLKTDIIGLKYEIYVLGNSRDKCKRALKRLRGILDTKKMSKYDVSRKYETTINAKVKACFSEFIGSCSAHKLRKAYSTICVKLYKEEKQAINSFLSMILGHGEDDVKIANSYQKYYIK